MTEQNNMAVETAVAGGINEAVEKLQAELKGANQKGFAEPIIGHLLERVKESESLAKDILQEHKTWDKCYDYIYKQARSQIKGSAGAIRDDVVYEWAEDYYHLDDKALEEKKAKEEAERKKKAAEKKQKNKTDSKKKPVAETKEKVAPKPKKEETKDKGKKTEMEGQMDLFSMMGL